MTKKKNHEPAEDDLEELVESVRQEKPPGKFAVEVEDYVADGPSSAPGPEIHTETPPVESDNEFGVDLSHLTPTARERTLEEMREGAKRVAMLGPKSGK